MYSYCKRHDAIIVQFGLGHFCDYSYTGFCLNRNESMTIYFSDGMSECLPVHLLQNNRMSCSNIHVLVFRSLGQSQIHLHN